MTGNPAAVCPLEAWLPAATMQAIACEMNLSETAFFAPVPNSGAFGIRWFTPSREVDLIGHATLAAGHLVLERLRPEARSVRFLSDNTELIVARKEGALALEMPALPPQPVQTAAGSGTGIGEAAEGGVGRQALPLRVRCRRRDLGADAGYGTDCGPRFAGASLSPLRAPKMPISSPAFLRQPTACPRIPCRV